MIRKIINLLYTKEKRTSESQLKIDFCDYPPFPLNCSELNKNFFIINTKRIGRLYWSVVCLKKLIKIKRKEEVPEVLREVWGQLFLAKETIVNSVKDTFCEINKLNKFSKFLFFVLVSFALLVVMPFIFMAIVGYGFYYLRCLSRLRDGEMGFFIPIFEDENKIFVGCEIKDPGLLDAVISHEHIHFLQHINGRGLGKFSRCADVLLKDLVKENKYFHYLFEANEVEARLHEIVVSGYRAQGKIPITIEEFIELLVGSEHFGSLILDAVKESGVVNEVQAFSNQERSNDPAEDIKLIILAIKNQSLRRRFIFEVLSTMYGNLLEYYGDKSSSNSFLSKIERPNLYDLLYMK